MPFGDYVEAVANAFRLQAEGQATSPPPLHIPAQGGGFHVKSASLPLGRRYVAIKTNAISRNRSAAGSAHHPGGDPAARRRRRKALAFLDSIEITIKRTGAATAVAARYLARPDSRIATICGCGEQGRISSWRRSVMCSTSGASSPGIEMPRPRPDLPMRCPNATASTSRRRRACAPPRSKATSSWRAPCRASRIWAGRGPSRDFIAAVGADNPDKSEIHPDLMARATVVTDILAQCATMGDLPTPSARRMTLEAVHAELETLSPAAASDGRGRTRSPARQPARTRMRPPPRGRSSLPTSAVWEPASGSADGVRTGSVLTGPARWLHVGHIRAAAAAIEVGAAQSRNA